MEQSSAIRLHHFHVRNGLFSCFLPVETTTMEGPTAGALDVSNVLKATVEKDKLLFDTLPASVSLNLTPPLVENQGGNAGFF